ncbi:MAG: division/cell wall cluster transcriptional repressor MraZ [Acidobacteriota bacterium]|nr:division/cell wall cluster transcriptional repressor MraZ [Blastocatellia bacterium]MDW8238084.1 division/cell wall cluster transcriptional repressor MraZ [Acidobacteriota bacterium]
MLRGHYKASIDDKGRLKIPAAFRNIIQEKYGTEFFVTSITGESALIYPLPEWEKIEARLAEPPIMDPAKLKFMDRTSYYGQQASMDPQGRILIHPLLREKAQLAGEVSVLGYLHHLDVWNTEIFERRLEEKPYISEDAAAIAKFGI